MFERLLFAELRPGVLLSEQNLDFAFALAAHGEVMGKCRIVFATPIAELQGEVVERHLTF